MNLRICEYVDFEFVDMRICGYTELWIFGYVDLWMFKFKDAD